MKLHSKTVVVCIASETLLFHPVTVNFNPWLWPSNLT